MPPPPDSALRFKPLAVLRSLFGVVVGYLVFAFGMMASVGIGWGGWLQAISTVLVPLAVVVLLVSLVLGGATAGILAGRRPGGHGMLVGVIALVVLVAGTMAGDPLEPGWFRIVGAVVSLPMAYLGAELVGYRRRER